LVLVGKRGLALASMALAAAHAAAAGFAPLSRVADATPHRLDAFLAECRARYADVDRRIDRAGVRDAGYFPVPGYPYLRTDRLLSSYRNELDGLDKFGRWMLQLREYDSLAREDELANLGMPKTERAGLLSDLRLCAVWLSFAELDDRPSRYRLSQAAQVARPHDSCDAAMAAEAVEPARRRQIAGDFAKAGTMETSAQVLWQPAPADAGAIVSNPFQDAGHDELGRLGLPMGEWAALAARHAPRILFDRDGEADVPGTPELSGTHAVVNTAQPALYYLVDYARLQGRTVVQLEYFVWFRTRNADVDGLIWRVTLDEQGTPLLYASIGAGGRDPLWFPVGKVHSRAATTEAAPLLPQAVPAGPFALRLQASSHRLVQLVTLDKAQVAKADDYVLHPYEELLALPNGNGGSHSLFDPRGVLRGASDDHACPDGDAARQWGHHPVSVGGQLYYFDDPWLIERLFVVP
jgi:hypothetical protein